MNYVLWFSKMSPEQIEKIDSYLDRMEKKYPAFNSESLKVNIEFCREGLHELSLKTLHCRFCNLERKEITS